MDKEAAQAKQNKPIFDAAARLAKLIDSQYVDSREKSFAIRHIEATIDYALRCNRHKTNQEGKKE